MKQPNFMVTIPKPCSENWEQMTPAEQGRFCSSCQRTIIDFTTFTDKELSQFLAGNKGKVCGMFQTAQLDRQLIAPVPAAMRSTWTKRIAATLFLFNTAFSAASARPARAKHKQEQAPVKGAQPAVSHTITGQLVDADTHEPIPGAKVCFQHGWKTAVTDEQGRFQLPVPRHRNDHFCMVYVLFPAGSVPVSDNSEFITLDSNFNANITLQRKAYGGVTVAKPPGAPVTHTRLGEAAVVTNEPYSLEKRIWSALSRPFRKKK